MVLVGHLLCTQLLVIYAASVEDDSVDASSVLLLQNQVKLKAHQDSTEESFSHDYYSGQGCWDYTAQYDNYDKLLGGNEDVGGDRCGWYLKNKEKCGKYDDDDFLAKEMCCSCDGGSTGKGARTLAVNGASVFLSEGKDCPAGFEPITSITACRAAMDLVGISGGSYKKTETDSDWPKGCYHCPVDAPAGCDQGVYFNKHSTGTTVEKTRRVCHKSYDATDVDILFVGDSDIDYWDSSVVFPGSMNVGIGGYETKHVIKEVGDWTGETNPKWVVLVIGENDIVADQPATTRAALNAFFKIATAFIEDGARVIYLGTKVEPDNKDLYAEYKSYDAAIRKFATAQSKDKDEPPFQMIDVFRSFTYKQTDGTPKGKDGTWSQIYASDEVHMSRLGYKLWNAWVKIAMDSKTPCIRWANAVCMEKR